ncbi:MAG: S41 family peptidase [Actinomycetota bacterium]
MTIAIISASLLFGVGVQVGGNRGSSNVDQAITTILDSSAKEIDRAILERAAIEGALKASGDEWANYFPKSALDVLEEQNSNMFTGIGVWLNRSRGGQVSIASLQEDSPASSAGLAVGDQLLEVNGTDVRGASLTSVVALIRGNVGKKVELLVNRDGKQILAAISNEKVALSTVEAIQVSSSVALVEIASFSRGTGAAVKESLSKLNYKSGIILDLRNNPGGLLEEAVEVSQLFIGNGVIVSYQVNGAETIYKASNSKPISVPVVVLINRNTASSAEIVASAFQDRNRGVVLGERSYGKGSVQDFLTLEDGSKLELTVALYVTPSGKIIDEVGVIPDLQVSPREISIKALQVLGGLAAFNSKKAS